MEFVKNKNIVVLDIETTGIKANTDKIIELYMLKVYNNEVVEEYHSKFNPEIEIPLFISNLTGIYQWHVNSSPTIDQEICLLYTSPSPRDSRVSRMPSSA